MITHDDEEEVLRSYNEVGRITSVTNERGKVTSYTYDDAGRLTQVTNAEEESGTVRLQLERVAHQRHQRARQDP
ncbi:MAG: RHS Repeat protein, partial [Armatimonadetes bacterium OLB18]